MARVVLSCVPHLLKCFRGVRFYVVPWNRDFTVAVVGFGNVAYEIVFFQGKPLAINKLLCNGGRYHFNKALKVIK